MYVHPLVITVENYNINKSKSSVLYLLLVKLYDFV